MKIVIAGGLGYIGSALCELYREKTEHKIVVVDKKFIPERVAALPTHIQYVEGNIADAEIMTYLLREADVLYLLAATVEAEKSIHKERTVWENNFEVPKNLIEHCPRTTRVMFASTGNVFGGVNEISKYTDLTEADEPRPKYPYAEAKREMEKYLLGSGRDFVILRFGTNYGYAPGIRFNLVTNLFVKKALTGQPLVVHGTGENYRPTVCVWDAAHALEYLSTRADAKGEIFHVVCESFKIKDLAERVATYCGRGTEVSFIAKEVPFSSYALSSEKIRKLGFRFEWTLESSVKEMVHIFHAIESWPSAM